MANPALPLRYLLFFVLFLMFNALLLILFTVLSPVSFWHFELEGQIFIIASFIGISHKFQKKMFKLAPKKTSTSASHTSNQFITFLIHFCGLKKRAIQQLLVYFLPIQFFKNYKNQIDQMQKRDDEKEPLSQPEIRQQKQLFSDKDPPPLSKRVRRPWKGIFLTYFLFFCGLLFFTHGVHKFESFSFWDIFAVWTLSALLLIPGFYFGMLILLIQLRFKGFDYKYHPELYQ